MNRLLKFLIDGNHSLVVENAGRVHTFDSRGVADLFAILQDNPALLAGACVADKIVGKGAAALMICGRVKSVATKVISTPALTLLAASGIPVEYETEVPAIINRSRTGLCPVEQLCMPYATAGECLHPISEFLQKTNPQSNGQTI